MKNSKFQIPKSKIFQKYFKIGAKFKEGFNG
jgi:hypothetical protein